MPNLSNLNSLLSQGLTLDTISGLVTCCRDLFHEDPSIPTFVAWSIFRAIQLNLDDAQAVQTSQIFPYVSLLLPKLQEWTHSEPSFLSTEIMADIVKMFYECERRAAAE